MVLHVIVGSHVLHVVGGQVLHVIVGNHVLHVVGGQVLHVIVGNHVLHVVGGQVLHVIVGNHVLHIVVGNQVLHVVDGIASMYYFFLFAFTRQLESLLTCHQIVSNGSLQPTSVQRSAVATPNGRVRMG